MKIIAYVQLAAAYRRTPSVRDRDHVYDYTTFNAGMNFAEGNAFKAIWRRAAQRTLGKRKAGAKDDGLYDAQKVEFFGARLVAQSKGLCDDSE